MPDFQNIGERIVWYLGEEGIYDKPIHVDDVVSLCVERLDTSIPHVRTTLSRNKQYFEKDENGMYTYSLAGASKYNKLKEGRQHITTANIEHFIKYYCKDQIDRVWTEEIPRIDIDFNTLAKGSDVDFAYDMLKDKAQYDLLRDAINEEINLWKDALHVEINITNLPELLEVGEVQTAQVGHLISVRARVLMQSPIQTRARVAAFECQRCNDVMQIDQPKTSVIEPIYCGNEMCNKKGPFKYIREHSHLIDQQTIMLEPPEGQITITAILQADLCEIPKVRDCKEVIVTGYLCVEPDFSKNGNGDHHRYIDVIGIELAQEDIELTDEDREIFKEWAKDPDQLRRNVIGTLAPDVIGRDDVKDALSLIFFSDTNWFQNQDEVEDRSSIHYLLIGDPGVAKSVLMKDVLRLALKSSFADAVNSTAAGLGNAYVQVEGVPMLKGGVLAKGDQGITGIDEIDKLGNKDDIKKLGSVLQEQKQTVDKGGLNMTFPGRTSVICTANPKYNRIDQYEDIYPQIDIPDHILTRFDWIIVMRDIPDARVDSEIIDSIFKRVRQSGVEANRAIPIDTFKKFLKYVREIPAPEMTIEMEVNIKKYFMGIRGRGNPEKAAPITHRTATDLIRIAVCVARREMSTVVTESHAEYAVRLYETCLATHNPDGELDFLAPTLAIGKNARGIKERKSEITKIIRGFKDILSRWPSFNELCSEAEKHDIHQPELEDILLKLSKEGELLQRNGKMMLI